jgi:hypothetical protein
MRVDLYLIMCHSFSVVRVSSYPRFSSALDFLALLLCYILKTLTSQFKMLTKQR